VGRLIKRVEDAMFELSDTEVAMLSLMMTHPLTFVPPRISPMAERLAQHGLAIYQDGTWFVTAEGIQITRHTIH
jgi:Mn-dependent DtxR family transcriptional regulator